MTKHFKAYTLPFSDPDQVKPADDDEIDAATEAYGDWLEIEEDICEGDSPSGQHEFNALLDPEICIHCGRRC